MGKHGTYVMMLPIVLNAERNQSGAKELGLFVAQESGEVLVRSNQLPKAGTRGYLADDR